VNSVSVAGEEKALERKPVRIGPAWIERSLRAASPGGTPRAQWA
jgi:hypothetical protein